jgi:hypothetical protein
MRPIRDNAVARGNRGTGDIAHRPLQSASASPQLRIVLRSTEVSGAPKGIRNLTCRSLDGTFRRAVWALCDSRPGREDVAGGVDDHGVASSQVTGWEAVSAAVNLGPVPERLDGAALTKGTSMARDWALTQPREWEGGALTAGGRLFLGRVTGAAEAPPPRAGPPTVCPRVVPSPRTEDQRPRVPVSPNARSDR